MVKTTSTAPRKAAKQEQRAVPLAGRFRKKLGEAFFADLDRSWQRHGGEVLDRLSTERPKIYFQVMVKLIQVWMLGQLNGFDRRRNRMEVLQRLEDIERLQRLTNGA